MLAHFNLKQNTWLCSKQSSFFTFYALPSGGKSKDAVVHSLRPRCTHLHLYYWWDLLILFDPCELLFTSLLLIFCSVDKVKKVVTTFLRLPLRLSYTFFASNIGQFMSLVYLQCRIDAIACFLLIFFQKLTLYSNMLNRQT